MKINSEFNDIPKYISHCDKINEEFVKDYAYKEKNNIAIKYADYEKNDFRKVYNAKKKSKTFSKILAAFATVAASTVVYISGISPAFATNIKAQIVDTYAYETGIFYSVSIEEFNENDEIYVVLQNDFTNRKQKIESEKMEGNFENLQTNMTYQLKVKVGNKVLASKTIRTSIDDATQRPNG